MYSKLVKMTFFLSCTLVFNCKHNLNKEYNYWFWMQFQVLGTDELNAYLNKYHLELDPQLDALVGRCV